MQRLPERLKRFFEGLLLRITFFLAGVATLIVLVQITSGPELLAGLLEPDSPEAIVGSAARLLGVVLGLWMIYRGLR